MKEAGARPNEVIAVRTVEQAAAWLELAGQISDGWWENSTPIDHWRPWTRAEVIIDPENVGIDFFPSKKNYDLSNRELLSIIGQRMLAIVRIARALGLDAAKSLQYQVSVEGIVDFTVTGDGEFYDRRRESLAKYDRAAVERAAYDESYSMKDLRRELVDLKDIIRDCRRRVES